MAQLEDGKGRGFKQAVNDENQALTKATIQSELEHESEENGSAYNWSSDIIDAAAGGATILLVKNTSDTPLHIEKISISSGTTASEYTIHLPTTEVTVTGNTITGTNLNTASSNVADALAATQETNNTQGNVIGDVFLAVDRTEVLKTDGLILGKNKSVAVDVVADADESSVTIIGHFEV